MDGCCERKNIERFCELKEKEVINICDGCRLGYVCDLEFERTSGKIIAIIIPEEGKCWSIFSHPREYRVPWKCITKIGDDIILIQVDIEDILVTNDC